MASRVDYRPPPNLRTHVTPAVLAYWEAHRWTVHRVGAAAYAHSPDGIHHVIVGVWARRDPLPRWASRLGDVSDGYMRRLERCWREQAWRRLWRDPGTGRFGARMPWWRWPQPALYRWDCRP